MDNRVVTWIDLVNSPLDGILQDLKSLYQRDGIVKLTSLEEILPSKYTLNKIVEELVCSQGERVEKYYENVNVKTNSGIEKRRVLTRLERFVDSHPQWEALAATDGVLSKLVACICGENEEGDSANWCLFKEKFNLKPPGGSGFVPHYDMPSLYATGLCQDIMITVMIAIDDMTSANGCLHVARGKVSESDRLPFHSPSKDLNPDTDGRPGAILESHASTLVWEAIECKAGDIFVFSGWLPHRSPANQTQKQRRAIFLTYNPASEGNLRQEYYMMMNEWRKKAKR